MTKNLKVSDKKLLVILPEANKNVYLSTRKIGRQKGGGGARRGDMNSPVLVLSLIHI